MGYQEVKHRATLDWEEDNIKIVFQPILPNPIDVTSEQMETETRNPSNLKKKNDQCLVLGLTPTLQNLIFSKK